MDITESLFQYSIKTENYGTLNFMVFPDDEKEDEIKKIKERSSSDKKFFENTFDSLFLRATNNHKKLEDIDKSKLSKQEIREFATHFFTLQFCEYKYNPDLSWEDNIKEGYEFQEERMLEVRKTLSQRLNLSLDRIKDSQTIKTMIGLSDSLKNFYDKPTYIPEPLQLSPTVVASHERAETQRNILLQTQNIDKNFSLFTTQTLQYSKTAIDEIHKLTDLVIKLTSATNQLIQNAKEQSLQAEQDSKKTAKFSICAILISFVALIFNIVITFYDIKSNKESEKIDNQKLELLESISEQSLSNAETFKTISEQNNIFINTIDSNMETILSNQKRIDEQIEKLIPEKSNENKRQ